MKLMPMLKKWLMTTKAYHYTLKHIIPYIRLSTYYTSMRGSTYHQVYNAIKPGDIILTIDRKKLTTFLIGGEFSHAALCVSKDEDFEVAEMTHNDYTESTVSDVCYEADRVVVLRCTDFDEDYTLRVIERCTGFQGTQYDNEFTLGIEALSCAELIYESDIERRLDISLEDVVGIGELYISPTGLWNGKNLELVIDTDNLDAYDNSVTWVSDRGWGIEDNE